MVTITLKEEQGIAVVTLAGRIDATTSSEIDQTLKPLAGKEDFTVIDLSQCHYLSSAGIRILLVLAKKLISKGGNLYLSGLLPEVSQVIEMAGLQQIFRLVKSLDIAKDEITRSRLLSTSSFSWSDSGFSLRFHPSEHESEGAWFWRNEGIVGYNELGFAIGIGSPAESTEEDPDLQGVFITNGYCAGFIPDDTRIQPDFRIPHNPSQAGIFVNQAISFGNQPLGTVRFESVASTTLSHLTDMLEPLKQHFSKGETEFMSLVVVDFNSDSPSASFFFWIDRKVLQALNRLGFDKIPGAAALALEDNCIWGGRFLLDKVPEKPTATSLSNFLRDILTFENVIGIAPLDPQTLMVDPISWVFLSNELSDARKKRLTIHIPDDLIFEPFKLFLVRRLYTDSASITVKPLHGGYSAQTFQVISYDNNKRKLRPTVLKIANRKIILRESERCQLYALPYILNNSAIVLGTHFFGETGALRYNFVGIGGEHTQLKWLAHYFNTWTANQLKPLFDKIFLHILNPWYGQPIEETIYPFTDHDPTLTFFSGLVESAMELLSVSPDNQFFHIGEVEQTIINPYWFLKNGFEKHRKSGMNYFTTICHGDLNMQNILLDEDMNVYLIDFSETKPRSAVSDFARLEAIFMIEHAPLGNEEEMEEYLRFIFTFYEKMSLDVAPVSIYQGKHSEKIERITSITTKMREYAFKTVQNDANHIPYCLALLEWILPVVCYSSSSFNHKRLSMIVAGILSQKVLQSDWYQHQMVCGLKNNPL
jgi:anti-anti-sigma factor